MAVSRGAAPSIAPPLKGLQAGQHPQKGSFTAAGGAAEGNHAGIGDCEGEAVQNRLAAKGDTQLFTENHVPHPLPQRDSPARRSRSSAMLRDTTTAVHAKSSGMSR